MSTNQMKVTAHVGRGLLQSAQVFKNEETVVWEYVVNSLQYTNPGVAPVVNVEVERRAKTITISDNGAGMDQEGLSHFFQMHGENLERKAGRRGRGKFGTGKSAAFAIAKNLQVSSVRNGVRNAVALNRAAIDASSGEEIPVEWLVRNEPTDSPNGTTIVISEIMLPRLDKPAIIGKIERDLGAFRSVSPQVAVDNHICEYHEPVVVETHEFFPSTRRAAEIGNVRLVVKVAKAPLEDHQQGIAVTAGEGNLIAIERCGIDRKEFGSYLFGDIDVPGLEEDSGIAAFDSTRSLSLNPKHPLVTVLLPFLGANLEKVRKQLVAQEKEARETEEARRLEVESSKIANILNEDFHKLKTRLRSIRSTASTRGPVAAQFAQGQRGGTDDANWVEGDQQPGVVEKATGTGQGGSGLKGRSAPDITRIGDPDDQGLDAVSPSGGSGRRQSVPKGGFRVTHRRLGADQSRSTYDHNAMTIVINLDHPVVVAARRNSSIDDPTFRRLTYEIAFSEYSFALGYELAHQDPDMPAEDLLYEIRSTLNRVSQSAAALYQ